MDYATAPFPVQLLLDYRASNGRLYNQPDNPWLTQLDAEHRAHMAQVDQAIAILLRALRRPRCCTT